MTKALVTGTTGFIGSHLVQSLLARREEVTCLVRTASAAAALEAARAGTVVGDVTDGASLPAAIAGQDVVYHLAGCLRAFHPRQLFQVNEQGLRNVAQTCARQPTPPVLVAVSSLAAAGPVLVGRAAALRGRSAGAGLGLWAEQTRRGGRRRGNSPPRSPSPSCGRRSSSARRIRRC